MDWEPAGLQETLCLKNWKRERDQQKSLYLQTLPMKTYLMFMLSKNFYKTGNKMEYSGLSTGNGAVLHQKNIYWNIWSTLN